jgi:hypothetical protein
MVRGTNESLANFDCLPGIGDFRRFSFFELLILSPGMVTIY